MIDRANGKRLLLLARKTIKSVFDKRNLPSSEIKQDKRGVFVTLTIQGRLRGCIGFPEPVYELDKAVILASKAAAFEDPRFPPLKPQELDKIVIEISVLTLPELISVEDPAEYLKKINIGEDGLILRARRGQGLLLPQVAKEYNWSVQQLLENLCLKAGLNIDSWKSADVKIYKFQAQIFREDVIKVPK